METNVILLLLLAQLPFCSYILARAISRRASGRDERQHLHAEERRALLPMRLQAYERFTLLLERISPEALLVRIVEADQTSGACQSALLDAIREEWHHNVSQQVYISSEAWESVKLARARVVHLITQCGAQVHADAPSIELSRLILSSMVADDAHPTLAALRQLQRDVSYLYA